MSCQRLLHSEGQPPSGVCGILSPVKRSTYGGIGSVLTVSLWHQGWKLESLTDSHLPLPPTTSSSGTRSTVWTTQTPPPHHMPTLLRNKALPGAIAKPAVHPQQPVNPFGSGLPAGTGRGRRPRPAGRSCQQRRALQIPARPPAWLPGARSRCPAGGGVRPGPGLGRREPVSASRDPTLPTPCGFSSPSGFGCRCLSHVHTR